MCVVVISCEVFLFCHSLRVHPTCVGDTLIEFVTTLVTMVYSVYRNTIVVYDVRNHVLDLHFKDLLVIMTSCISGPQFF